MATRDLAKSGPHYFCRWHRSHFCPCTGALKYRGNLADAIAKWDAAEERRRERGNRKA